MKKILQKYKKLSPKIRASLWFTICIFFQKGISVISTPVFTRLLSTTEYGNYNVFNSWLEIITIFVSLKLSAGVYLQGMVKFGDEKNVFSSSLQGLTFMLTILWTIIYVLFYNFWNSIFQLTTVQMMAMLVMIWASAVFNFWATEQRVEYKYHALVVITVIASIAKPVVGIIFVINAEDKVTARILGLALVEMICYSFLFIIQMKKGGKFYSRQFWKYALMFNLPLVPHYLSTTVLNSADRIMIRNMVGADKAGIYSLSYQLSQVMTLFSTALVQSIQPWLYGKIREKKVNEIKKAIYPAFIIMVAISVLVILCAPEILVVFAPSSYQEAVWVIPPVVISVYFIFAYTMFASFEFYFEKSKYIAVATVTGAVLNIILNYIFIKLFGYIAAGYTTLICYMLFALFHYAFMRKICRDNLQNSYPFDTKIVISISGILIGIGALSLSIYSNFYLRYSLIILLLIIIIIYRKAVVPFVLDILKEKNKK